MQVKISYSVDINEVPDLINRILSEAKQKLAAAADDMKPIYDINKMADQIDDTRNTLSLVDSQLEDVVNLAAGWLEIQISPDGETVIDPRDVTLQNSNVEEQQETKNEQED